MDQMAIRLDWSPSERERGVNIPPPIPPCESSSQTRSGKIGAESIIDEQINIQEAARRK